MQTDSFFQIGVTHEVCEDYAVNGTDYAIVSDGCSNGGGPRIDTDFGSRILCKTAERYLPKMFRNKETFMTAIGVAAESQIRSLGMPIESLTATLLVMARRPISEDPDFDYVETIICGDGVTGGRMRDGTWVIRNYEFLPGGDLQQAAPFYLKYRITDEVRAYYRAFGGQCQVTTHSSRVTGEWDSEIMRYDLDLERPWITGGFNPNNFDFVFVGTDGLSSFYRQVNVGTSKHNEPVPLLDVLSVLFDIKSFKGPFLRRQRQWAFKRPMQGTFLQRGWHNSDDVSVGGMHVGE